MTKPRPRRDRSDPEIDEVSWRYLCDATTPEDDIEHGWLLITLEFDDLKFAVAEPPSGKSTSQLWEIFGPQILRWWTKEAPGTRPKCWCRKRISHRRRRYSRSDDRERQRWACRGKGA